MTGPEQQRLLDQWLEFSLRQAGRTAPHPAAPLAGATPGAGYRLSLRHLECLPLFQADVRSLDVRLGVTLFDEAAGCFFGATAHSRPVAYDMRMSKGKRGFHVDLDFTLFMHMPSTHYTTSMASGMAGMAAPDDGLAGPGGLGKLPFGDIAEGNGFGAGSGSTSSSGLLAVVEVVLVERSDKGVTISEHSAGWCAVPLELPTVRGLAAGGGAGQVQHASHLAPGSPGLEAAAAGCSCGLGLLRSRARSPAKGAEALLSSQAAGSGSPAKGARSLPKTPLAGTSLCPVALVPAAAASGFSQPPQCCQQGTPKSPVRGGCMAARLWAGALLCVPVFVGSPRYLLLQRAMPDRCYPPVQLTADGAECRLHYQCEACPEMDIWAPLLPSSFLVSQHDVLPGLQRVAAGTGTPTLASLGIHTLLDPPQLQAVHAVVLTKLSMHLPDGFVDMARKQAPLLWQHSKHGTWAGPMLAAGSDVHAGRGSASMHGGQLVPMVQLQQHLRLRVSVHNGRRFVGPPVMCTPAALEPVEGRRGEHRLVLGQDAPLAWVPADRFVAVVLELVLLPLDRSSGTTEQGAIAEVAVLGWAAVMPYKWHDASCHPVIDEGCKQVALRSGPGRWLRHTPVLDWRRLLERTNRPSPQPPTVTFALQHAPGQGMWPSPAAPVTLQLPGPNCISPAHQQRPGGKVVVTAAPPSPAVVPALDHNRTLVAGEGWEWRQPSAAVSEAETLASVRREGGSLNRPPSRLPSASPAKVALQGSKALVPQTSVQAWQIHANYDGLPVGPSVPSEAAAEGRGVLPRGHGLPSIRVTPRQQQAQGQGQEAVQFEPCSSEEVAALYAGSPVARQAQRQRSRNLAADGGGTAPGRDAVAAAVARAVPAAEVAGRRISLATELQDPLATCDASLQFLAFLTEPSCCCCATGSRSAGNVTGGSSCCCAAAGSIGQQVPSRVHFTFRWFTSAATVTGPVCLEPVDASGGCGMASGCSSGGQAYTLLSCTTTSSNGDSPPGSGGGKGRGAAAAPEPESEPTPALTQQLLDAAAVDQQVQLLIAQGVPLAAAAGLVRQQRLRAARYLADRQLQVDVWDSTNLLQVGTLWVPLRGLLRQGSPSAEVVMNVAVADQAQWVQRLEGTCAAGPFDGSSGIHLCTGTLRGSFLVRLACTGRQLQLPSLADLGASWLTAGKLGPNSSSGGWPASPIKRATGCQAAAVVVRARSALEGAGQVALEVARREGVPEGVAEGRLQDETVSRAASNMQRLVLYQSLTRSSTPTPGRLGCPSPAADNTSIALPCNSLDQRPHQLQASGAAAAAAVGQQHAERQLLAEVEASRERCKRDVILSKLQAELPSYVVICANPGEAVAFERQFVNSSSEAAWFELCIGACSSQPGGAAGSPATSLSLVSEAAVWDALAPAARLAGLAEQPASSGDGVGSGRPHVVTSARFKLEPRETCLLHFQLTCNLWGQATPPQQPQPSTASTLTWHDVSIRRMGGTLPPTGPSAPAAAFKVAAVRPAGEEGQPGAVVDHTMRLYCPAASSTTGATVVHAVQLTALPHSHCLVSASSAGTWPGPAAGLAFACSSPGVSTVLRQDGVLLLSCPAPAAGTTQRFLLAAWRGQHLGSSSDATNSSSSGTGQPVEVWEVLLHGLPALRLAAGVGSSTATHRVLPGSGQQLSCHWRGCSRGEVQADVGPHSNLRSSPVLGNTASTLALRFSPTCIARRELLLSVVEASSPHSLRPRQAELLLLLLDSTGTAVSRTFEVRVAQAQVVSKKVRYCSPYEPHQRRCFAVRAMHSQQLLRTSQPLVELAGGEAAYFRLTLDASRLGGCCCAYACSSGSGSGAVQEDSCQGQRQQEHEVLAVMESFPVAGSSTGDAITTRGAASTISSSGRVEEVFKLVICL